MYTMVTNNDKTTTIRINRSTKKILEKESQKYMESMDAIICRILKIHKNKEKNEAPAEYEDELQ